MNRNKQKGMNQKMKQCYNQILEDKMEKEQLFQQNYSEGLSEDKKLQPKKRQHIKKDLRRKDKRKRQTTKPQIQEPVEAPEPVEEQNNHYTSFQSQTSKYQRLDEFWKVDIQNLYRKEFTTEDKQILQSVLNEEKPSILQVLKYKQNPFNQQKISLELLYKYLTFIQEFNGCDNYTFVALERQNNKKQHYVLVMDKQKNIQKAVQVSQDELSMLAFRQLMIQKIRVKREQYNKIRNANERLNEIETQIIVLIEYIKHVKNKLDEKLKYIEQKAMNQPKFQPPTKVQDNYISFLIKKNLKKALENQEIDFFNHFKMMDIYEHVSGLNNDVKPITDKKEFEEYIRKRKLKKSGKKARWVLKTACGGCLSHFHQMYNPFSFCTQCHVRYHKYCYIPRNEGICESCFLSKNNQTKRSRINECQLCGSRGFLYLPMDESNNAHIFCMLINGLWRFQNTQILFQKKYIENAIQNVSCVICKQSNSCIYKCECCQNHAHPLCAFIQGWGLRQQASPQTGNDIVKLQCCNGVQKEKNEKRRRFVLNYKRCVFSQFQ